jgi:hypothetical protein
VFSDGLKKIGEEALLGCTSLTSVMIPKGVILIDSEVFRGCSSLETITLPIGVKKIGDECFKECISLKTIYVPAKKTDYYKSLLDVEFHSLIVEQEPVKKVKGEK